MAVKWISEAWEADLKTRAFPTERIYIDFRQQIYPPISGRVGRGSVVEGILVGETVAGAVTTAT